jgi:hypothetical protein
VFDFGTLGRFDFGKLARFNFGTLGRFDFGKLARFDFGTLGRFRFGKLETLCRSISLDLFAVVYTRPSFAIGMTEFKQNSIPLCGPHSVTSISKLSLA